MDLQMAKRRTLQNIVTGHVKNYETKDGEPVLDKAGQPVPKDYFTYADLILLVMKQPDAKGVTIGEMKSAFDIIDAAEEADSEIKLKDTDVILFKKKLSEHKWPAPSRELVKFQAAIEAL